MPLCVHALGAASLDKVATLDGVNPKSYDFVIVEDRDKSQRIPAAHKASNQLCNVSWLKQCVVSSIALVTVHC